ncbi:hypothetical protein [Nannocystis punicea]|uniref:DUF4476 domain-containing protein n=1 Tax=Nannocystis punicea TaxID=2995304 RepID=A0ABY7HDG4_9BACT|nr:hypothetical protein [Nannocystis poenicansa]WAS97328.1 hypothetical protein O0S08_14365 [Nannocystis poenicansa]
MVVGIRTVTIASSLLLACSTDPPPPHERDEADACAVRVDREIACGPEDDRSMAELTRGQALGECHLARGRDPERDAAELACAQQLDCGAFRRCRHDIAAREQAASVKPVVATALASGTGVSAALRECQTAPWIGDAELTQQCDELLGREVDRLSKTVEAMRDAGDAGGADYPLLEIEECQTLPWLAERQSRDAFVRAVALCDEMAAAPDAATAIAEAKKALTSDYWRRIPSMPPGCFVAFNRLVKIETPWARQRLRQVVDLCHVQAAKQTLATALRTIPFCPPDYEQIVAAVTMFEIDDPEHAALLARMRKRCVKP